MSFNYQYYNAVYLKSGWWKNERVPAFWKTHDKKCEACWTRYQPKKWWFGKAIFIIVHHVRYDNLWHEPDDDLRALCTPCHRIVHQIERQGRFRTLQEATDWWINKRSRQAARAAAREGRKLVKKLAKAQ